MATFYCFLFFTQFRDWNVHTALALNMEEAYINNMNLVCAVERQQKCLLVILIDWLDLKKDSLGVNELFLNFIQ